MKAQIIHKNGRKVIDFPDANFKDYLVSEFDADADGEIGLDDALSVTVIHIENKQIGDLSGIEYFTNLQRLDCSHNDLMILDLRHNRRLETLRCVANRLLGLRLDGCENLTGLYCGANRIGSLDLRTNTKLEVLQCQRNFIKLLVLSKNINLNELQAEDNPLEIVEVNSDKRPEILNIPISAEIAEITPEILKIIDSIRDSRNEN